ncbi:MAG TPA: tetratricopeptide repeat protein [Trebonia sp.]
MTQAMLGLAGQLGASSGDVAEALAGRVNPSDVLWPLLEAVPGWVLVLDNADDVTTLTVAGRQAGEAAGWLRPTPAGLVVVTSRTGEPRVWGPIAQVHRINSLDDPHGGQVLLDLAPSAGDHAEARLLSARLGGLPLALHQAGTYLASPFAAQRTFAAYRSALEERFGELLGRGNDDRGRVTGTWELSLAALKAQGYPQARALLQVLSCLAGATSIPSSLLNHDLLARCGGGTAGTEDGLSALLAIGLIELRNDTSASPPTVVVHPLVAETIRHQAGPSLQHSFDLAAGLLQAAAIQLNTEDLASLPDWQALVPHLRFALALNVSATQTALAALADATARASWALSWAGADPDALELADTALGRMTSLDDSNASVLALKFQRAVANRYLGRIPEAESEFRQVTEARQRTLGAEHQDTLTAEHYLAVTLADSGRLSQAERIFRQVLDKRLKALGPDNPHTLATRHWIAAVLSRQGMPDQAEAESRRVHAARQQILGPDHPSTLATLCDIGHYQADQGKITEAEAIFSRVLDAQTRTMAPDHPRRLRTHYEIASVLAAQGRVDEAGIAFEHVLEAQTRVLGRKHPDTLKTAASISRLKNKGAPDRQ